MSVGRICTRVTMLADKGESVQAAATRMKTENVGSLVIVDDHMKPIGILTDRDVATRLVAEGRDARRTRVEEIMTAHPRWVTENAPIEEAVKRMRTLGTRRLPVVDFEERLVGIVCIDDVLELVIEELSELGRVIGLSQPGVTVPVARPAKPREPEPETSGLERASADLQC